MTKIARNLLITAALTLVTVCSVHLHQSLQFPYDDYLRIHVLANSDTVYDQQLKLLVRDEIIRALSPALRGAADAADARTVAEERLAELEKTAEAVVRRQGYDYAVTAEVGNFDFPNRQYDNLFLPAGNYQALRICIGKAEGQNWWCVLYPPLCLAADEKSLTTVPQKDPEKRFFLRDWWQELRGKDQ